MKIQRMKAIIIPRKKYKVKMRIEAFVNGMIFGGLSFFGYMIGTFIFN